MTGASIKEHVAALRERHVRTDRAGEELILDELCGTTVYHRKSAMRLLRPALKASRIRRGRKKTYAPDMAQALRNSWEATDHICSKRLAPFLTELVPILGRHGELVLSNRLRRQLVNVGAAMVDRLLAPYRHRDCAANTPTGHSPSALKAMIPI